MANTTVRQRIRQLATGTLAILSLSVSSVAACMCSHHEPSKQTETRSCHGPAKTHHDKATDQPKHSSFGESCNCVRRSANLSVKSEGFKLKKHVGAVAETARTVRPEFSSPTPAITATRSEQVSIRRPDRPPSSRGPPLS